MIKLLFYLIKWKILNRGFHFFCLIAGDKFFNFIGKQPTLFRNKHAAYKLGVEDRLNGGGFTYMHLQPPKKNSLFRSKLK